MEGGVSHLIVKYPSDKIPSFSVVFKPNWSVKDLKQHLCENYPTHPEPTNQRIIYAGKLLKDELLLSNLFKNSRVIPTVHLVCRYSDGVSKSCGQSSGLSPSVSPSNSADTLTSEQLQEYQRQYFEYLKNFYMGQMNPSNGYGFWPQPYPYPVQLPNWPPSSQYGMTGFNLQDLNQTSAPGTHASSMSTHPESVSTESVRPVNGPNNNNAREPDPPQPQQAMGLGNPMAAGLVGGEQMGENAGELDLVDRFYMVFRLILFIGLCLAYSSLDKAIIVFSIAAYVYFYNIYRRHAALRRAAQIQPPQEQPNPVPSTSGDSESSSNSPGQETSTQDQQLRERVANAQPQEPTTEQAATPPVPRARGLLDTVRSVVSISFQFFASLITSLIPEQPPPIRLD